MPFYDQATRAASAMKFTEEVTTRWSSRLAGSAACLACAEHLEKSLSSFCDRTENQTFSVRPGAFLGYIRINIVLFGLAMVALYFYQLKPAVGLASLSLLITVLEFFIYQEFVDFLFPEKTGKNVYGTIEPSGTVKQQIIISAHHDSAHIFNFLEKDPATYARKVLAGTATQLALVVFTWLLLIMEVSGLQSLTLYWILTGVLTLAAFSLYPLWHFYSAEGTPGAGDNLICTALAMEIGKYFSQEKVGGNGLQHTRLIIASWDAEECGLRGARAYVKQHKAELHRIKTYNFNLECMYDHRAMSLLRSDLNSFVPLSGEMAEECNRISQEMEYPVEIHPFPFLAGGTDAAEFAKAGVEATTLAAMDWKNREPDTAYHTTRDTIEAVDQEAVARSIAIGVAYVWQKDKQQIITSS